MIKGRQIELHLDVKAVSKNDLSCRLTGPVFHMIGTRPGLSWLLESHQRHAESTDHHEIDFIQKKNKSWKKYSPRYLKFSISFNKLFSVTKVTPTLTRYKSDPHHICREIFVIINSQKIPE